MPDVTPRVFAWISSFQDDVRSGTSHFHMNIGALESSLAGPGNIRVLGAAGQRSKATYNNSDYSVFGLIEFRPTHTYTHELPLSPQERRQYSFWRQIINDDMEGAAIPMRGQAGVLI